MALRKLTCPSCGAAVDIPVGLDRAHCVYCGSEIIIEQTEASRRSRELANYLQLGETALEAGNTEEAKKWFNEALELDVRNDEAWAGKALTVSFAESLICLERTFEINPNSSRAEKAKRETILRESRRLHKRALEELTLGAVIAETGGNITLQVGRALAYLEAALVLTPDDETLLENILDVCTKRYGQAFKDLVKPTKKRIRLLQLREKAETELPTIRQKLAEVTEELAQAEKRGGLFSGGRIKKLRDREQSLVKSIEEYEEALNYDLDYRPASDWSISELKKFPIVP